MKVFDKRNFFNLTFVVIADYCGIEHEKKINQITREDRRRLTEALKHFALTVKCPRPITEAIITSGGVNTKQINPSTMESKLTKGLYFAGEVLDLDAVTGGFNLQIAWSTGHLAGSSIPFV